MSYRKISLHRSVLMGIAALYIFYGHIGDPLFSGIPGLSAIGFHLWRQSFIGVDVFLLLSSFGLAHAFSKGNFHWSSYLKKRVLRIYPVFFLTCIFIAWYLKLDLFTFAKIATLYMPFFENLYCCPWFVPVILLFYLLAPLYYRHLFAPAKNKTALTAIAIGGIVLLGGILSPILRIDLYGAFWRLPVFLLGFLWGHYSIEDRKLSRKGATACLLLSLSALGINALYHSGVTPELLPVQNALVNLPIVPGLLIVAVAATDRLSKRPRIWRLLSPLLAFFGGISLEFYCIQENVWRLMLPYAADAARFPLQMACLMISTALAVLLRKLPDLLTKTFARS